MIVVISTRVNGSCANCGIILPKLCNFTNHEKSGKISASVQCQARFPLNFEENLFLYSCNLDIFCDKRMAIPQIKLVFSGLLTVGLALFWPLSIVWLFLEVFIWQL